jgi:hypothetical protein
LRCWAGTATPCAARAELWENQLRALARAFGIALDFLPPKKSAPEKLLLAAAMKLTTSVARSWLAQRVQMGAASSLGPLLYAYRTSGGFERPEIKAALSRFLA